MLRSRFTLITLTSCFLAGNAFAASYATSSAVIDIHAGELFGDQHYYHSSYFPEPNPISSQSELVVTGVEDLADIENIITDPDRLIYNDEGEFTGFIPLEPTPVDMTAHAASSSNLSTGELKIDVYAEKNDSTDYKVKTSASASFSDTFSFKNKEDNQLFSWGDNDEFIFNVAFDGIITNPANLDLNDYSNWHISFLVFEEGTIEKNMEAGRGLFGLEPNYFNPDEELPEELIAGASWWSDNLGAGDRCYGEGTTCDREGVTINDDGFLMDNFGLAFNPEGNFDWYLTINANANALPGQASTIGLDFSHTLKTEFQIITTEELVVLSDSGVYPQTQPNNPVPEPTTMLLFGTGIAGLAAAGRRRRK